MRAFRRTFAGEAVPEEAGVGRLSAESASDCATFVIVHMISCHPV